MTKGRVAYVMSRFPHLSETFILREMLEMERLGWEVLLFPLILQKQSVVHPAAAAFLPRAWDVRLFSARVLAANLAALFRRPGLYLSTAARVLWENRASPKFLLRSCVVFPKSVFMARAMQRAGVRHVHAHYATHPALAAWIIQRFSGIPYSITVHAHDIYVEKAMLARKLRGASFISAVSAFNRDYLVGRLDAGLRAKIHVVRCGVLPENYRPDGHVRSAAAFELVSVGSLQPYKGQCYLVEACALLKQRGLPLRCRIVGGGELFTALAAQIEAAGLADCVELLGARTQEEVAALLPAADAYVQPSVVTADGKMEGIPVGLMEAMACGLPVVATRISGVPELVQDGLTGLLVPPRDGAALAGALERLYRDSQLAGRLAAAGRQLVLEQYNLRENVRELSLLVEQSIR